MEGGQILESGSYEQLSVAGTAFEQLVNARKDSMRVLDNLNNEIHREYGMEDTVLLEESTESYTPDEKSNREISVKGVPGAQLIEEEAREVGDIGWKPFLDYLLILNGTLLL